MVGLYRVDVGALRAPLQRGRRYDEDVLSCIDQEAGIDELAGEEQTVLIVKVRLEFYGARGRIDLVVGGQRAPRGKFLRLLAVVRIDLLALPLVRLVRTGGRLSSGMGKMTVMG